MTETHSLGDWEKKIKGKDILPYPHQDDGTYYPEYDKYKDIFTIITSDPRGARGKIVAYNSFRDYVLAQKEGFRREIAEMMKDITAHLESGMNPRTQEEIVTKITNYNQGLKDLLTKLDTNGI